ncbi:uncharacterized protein MAM_04545 [Metarhizium album ARSEF 1941]|uniref:Uncharacterized protein n=1 Tax=Metarhizium album (strain ARSEF 1941) TaxID=1081103 RepID=A0A0B2WXD4_METAS|nr:uncharacterized protein MAM_04545 [Metarhizium album ARSEF 1941]KHN97530.1 hypothetical protein MAM_04545 [Metarhizium album ARSEF 1941]
MAEGNLGEYRSFFGSHPDGAVSAMGCFICRRLEHAIKRPNVGSFELGKCIADDIYCFHVQGYYKSEDAIAEALVNLSYCFPRHHAGQNILSRPTPNPARTNSKKKEWTNFLSFVACVTEFLANPFFSDLGMAQIISYLALRPHMNDVSPLSPELELLKASSQVWLETNACYFFTRLNDGYVPSRFIYGMLTNRAMSRVASKPTLDDLKLYLQEHFKKLGGWPDL